jgi:hypothetical protein
MNALGYCSINTVHQPREELNDNEAMPGLYVLNLDGFPQLASFLNQLSV